MADQLTARDRQIAAIGWDAAVASMRYEDGSPVELVAVVNPYREVLPNRAPYDKCSAHSYVEAGKEQED